MSERDPRQDPRPGDVVRVASEQGPRFVRDRLSSRGDRVVWTIDSKRFYYEPVPVWERECRGAEVVSVAAAGAEGA